MEKLIGRKDAAKMVVLAQHFRRGKKLLNDLIYSV